jgi:hypothetical protein
MDDTTTADTSPLTKGDLIEQKIDKVFKTPPTVVMGDKGALAFANMAEVIEAAKMMAMAGAMIPPWLQGNPGACWAILVQASHWGFEPVAVARMAYETTNKEGLKQVNYMSQLQHALIEARAPLRRRLGFTYQGEGESRVCTCSGHLKGEVDPLLYVSPPLRQITPKRSPLWSSDPDQQLAYYSSRAWARRYCPDILMGVYGDDEDLPVAANRAVDVTPAVSAGLRERLEAAQAQAASQKGGLEGFAPSIADSHPTAEAETAQPAPEPALELPKAPEPAKASRQAPAGQEPAPQKGAKAAKPAPLPRTAEQYRKYVSGWLRDCSTEQQVEERWRGERKLRNASGVTEEDRNKVRLIVDQRIHDIRQG